jgi:hypothetical protein
MNAFILDADPSTAAHFHCDKHVVKMIVESMQMLGSAVIRHGATPDQMPLTAKGTPLRGGYHHHPCTRWTGDSRANYDWIVKLAVALCDEYTYRYNKVHASTEAILHLAEMTRRIPDGPLTPFAVAISPEQRCRQAVPDFDKLDVVDQYRLYYIHDKADFAKWTARRVPFWFTSHQHKTNNTTK